MGIRAAQLHSAIDDFRRARRQANWQAVLARLAGKSADLLSYEDVRRQLRATQSAAQRLEDIPLDAIVGSVGRYTDFTRTFLPRLESDKGRWARVKAKMDETIGAGLPPIEVYRIGEAYFVLDGNHRVSAARQLGYTHIQAYVTEVHTRVDLSPDVQPDGLIIKAEYVDFLENTRLDELRPGADLDVTAAGQYKVLEEHISVHRYFMGLEQQREIPYEEAVTHWYDAVYMPVMEIVRARGMLRECPGRTETDLYLWLADHRAALAEEIGWEVGVASAAADLVDQCFITPQRVAARVGERVRSAIVPTGLDAGPPPGQWRQERLTGRQTSRLFSDILVAVNGEETGWNALEYALFAARYEEAQVHGLHVVSSEVERESPEAHAARAGFRRRCEQAGVSGEFVVETGEVSHRVCERSRWTDLVVLSLSYPPDPQPIARIGSGMSAIIRRCPRPVLLVPQTATGPRLERLLLAYDGSPKAEEALFVATYISGRWNIPPVVVTVTESERTTPETGARAQEYLEAHGVESTLLERQGPVATEIMVTAEEYGCDLVVMGGYGSRPMLEVVLGSAVDEVLRTSRRPVLICR
jgi:nucleotide-binding universal stress UspA family protein